MIEILENFSLWGNSGLEYLKAVAILVGVLILLKIFREIVLHRLAALSKKTATDVDDTIIDIIKNIKANTYIVVALFIGLQALNLMPVADKLLIAILILFIIYEVSQALEAVLNYIIKAHVKREAGEKGIDDESLENQTKAMGGIFKLLARVIVWSFGLILLLQNLGVEVTSLIAGLGIGGIAIALALQNVLADLFSALSIYIDRPFQIGDFIKSGADMGTVERIGLKTTRIRSNTGEELVVSNKELTDARVQNYGRLERRRALFSLGVVYGVKPEKLQTIPGMIEEIISANEKADFDRCHFKSFGDSSLNFEVVYWVNSSEYGVYMSILQEVNLAIYERFAKEKIEFAYPTQTLYLEK